MGVVDLARYGALAGAVLGALFLVSYGLMAMAMVVFGDAPRSGGRRIGVVPLRLLKTFHLLCAASWIGSAVTMAALSLLAAGSLGAGSGPGSAVGSAVGSVVAERETLVLALRHADRCVIIPTALGTVASGLLLAFFSGLSVRVPWVAAKGLGGFWALGVGWWFVTPIIEGLSGSDAAAGAGAFFPPSYFVVGGVQAALLGAMLLVSVFRPWRSGLLRDE
ncbi:MAG: hypothetical protein AB7D51_04020 [Desulfovibrionaceae bacterium]